MDDMKISLHSKQTGFSFCGSRIQSFSKFSHISTAIWPGKMQQIILNVRIQMLCLAA